LIEERVKGRGLGLYEAPSRYLMVRRLLLRWYKPLVGVAYFAIHKGINSRCWL